MLSKYQKHMNDIYEYIHNRIEVGIVPETVANEVIEKYRPEIFITVDKSSLYELMYRFAEYAYFIKFKKYYKR